MKALQACKMIPSSSRSRRFLRTARTITSLTSSLSALDEDAVPSHRFHVYKPAGLVKREVWERTWADQRLEDAGDCVTPEAPPPYASGDFLKPEYWQLRGKLDVPKERFIAFTEVPGRTGAETLYGWAGWTPTQRIKAMLAIDEDLEDAAIPLADRIGLLDSAWRLLPDAAREDAASAARLKAELQALVGPDGPSKEQLEDWKKRFPPRRQKPPNHAPNRSAKKTPKRRMRRDRASPRGAWNHRPAALDPHRELPQRARCVHRSRPRRHGLLRR